MGRRLWVTVADTGKGMSPPERTAVLDGAHDTGLGQIRHFARSCHARFRLRSAVGRGTVAVLMIPLVLNVGLTRQAGSLAPAGGKHGYMNAAEDCSVDSQEGTRPI
ncbi:hypothetical protein ACFSHP_18750 [Novosphingobium panipatense]